MIIITYCLAVLLFCIAFYFTRLLTTCHQLITTAKISVATIADKNLNDFEKEIRTQTAAIDMLKNSIVLFAKLALTIGVTLSPLWLADAFGLAEFSETSAFSLRPDVLAITTIIATAIVTMGKRIFRHR